VLLFPDFRQDFTVVDDLERSKPLPPFPEVQSAAGRQQPRDPRGAGLAGDARLGREVGAGGPAASVSFDYVFGMNANQFALHNPEG